MDRNSREKEFEQSVKKKFDVYNSLFLNLPFRSVSSVGMLIPFLHHAGNQGLKSGSDPQEIIRSFFRIHTDIQTEKEEIDFMFRVIQYVERQVVLYDSVEDAAFPRVEKSSNHLSLKDFIHLMNRDKGSVLSEKLSSFSARIVFTAHPTQFYPPSVLDIMDKLRSLITDNDINGIDITLQQLGLTSLINAKKPTPLDEAKNIIYFLRNIYYDAIGEVFTNIKNQFPGKEFNNTDIIKLGFWPGGDRDGNPFVTTDITLAVADQLRMTLMKCYYQDIKKLEQLLTFREVEGIIANLRNDLYSTLFDPGKIIRYDDIIDPLCRIREYINNQYNRLYIEDVDQLIDKVRIFKTHFATLDIRQDHSVHKRTVEAILKRENIIRQDLGELGMDELISILLQNQITVDPDDYDEEILKDTIRTISQLHSIQERNGEDGCNRYIISNSEDIYSVLFVYGLFRWCGWENRELTFDIVPLFESMEGMDNAGTIMENLFRIPAYREHLDQRRNKQTMMLGFSDGTKDGGYLKANWSISNTKEILSEVCDRFDIKAIFFDGRGGPPARGGGKTHRFYAAQSQRTANHEIQLTIQGQTISSKYGTREHFIHNCEQLLTAGLSHALPRQANTMSEGSREMMEELARISFEKYSALKNHEMFIPYLENKSPLKYYGKANIGSRPAKRGQKEKLELKDLRAIPFVGSWSQLKQNVPGYFGIGTALQSLIREGKLNDLKALFSGTPFFKALILNSMMSLSKCNFALTAYMQKDEEYGEFWNILFEEYILAKEMVLLISDYSILMEEEPVSRSSIEIRERIVLPLLIIQQYALQQIERNSEFKDAYEKIVERSLYGNINASRNSA